jgi:cytoskeletal protein RodZ
MREPRAILADVSIGGTLAGARHEAGMTVAEVSARTRIREALIRAIEQDEFGSCGGDFYARGHIRAIAAVVGADSRALISEYDAAHPSGEPVTLEDLLKPPPSTPRGRRRRRRSWLIPAVLLLCLGVSGTVAYQLAAGTGGSRRLAAVSPSRVAARAPAASHSPRPSLASPAPASAAVPLTVLTPVSAVAFGPGGTSDGDNPQDASLALSGDPASPWHTDWYMTAGFGDLKAGTGLLLDLGRTVTATSATVQLGDTPGASLQVRAGTAPADLRVVASAADAGGTVRLRLSSHPQVRYLLIWFTLLPPDTAGTYQAAVSGVTVTGFPG